MKWPYEHFKPEELLSPDGLTALSNKNVFKLQGFAVSTFIDWRKFLDMPIICNQPPHLKYRGYRSSKENALNTGQKGVEDSFHTQGVAFDSHTNELPILDYCFLMTAWTMRRIAEKKDAFHGIGCYPHRKFAHSDCRTVFDDYCVLWNGKLNKTSILHLKEVSLNMNTFFKTFKEKLFLPLEWTLHEKTKLHKNINYLFNNIN